MSKQKLELTWVGKEKRTKLEPRILIEDPEKSYHASKRISDSDIFDNVLIHGDNLLALKALEQDYAGKVKCIYIDPPFNTGAAFEYYDDGLEHSIWLGLMKERFNILKNLLSEDGVMFVNLDDTESAYAKILLDETFGRENYLNEIIVATNKPFGFKSTSESLFKQANHLLFYAKNRIEFYLNSNAVFIEKDYDPQYKWVFSNTDKDESEWTWENIREVVARELGFLDQKLAKKELGDDFENEIFIFAIRNAQKVFRTASVTGGALLKRKDTISSSKKNKNKIIRHPNDDMDYMFIGGERVIFYKERLKEIDGILLPGDMLTDLWTDISIEGLASEGGVSFPKGKKPEKLLHRCISLTTKPGDLVLDSFLGSGTTAAVAHKMGRRWIGIELGEHCDTHCMPRLKKVIDGEDQGGISRSVNWQGGGGFRYYDLAPSLIKFDDWGNPIINKQFDEQMLVRALCKVEGFKFNPSPNTYWQQGTSTETDFIYVTTQHLTSQMLQKLSEDVGNKNSLLICCGSFDASAEGYPNLTIKKIPKAILKKCEWNHDDYSLEIKNLPMSAPTEPTPQPQKRSTKRKKNPDQMNLFGGNE